MKMFIALFSLLFYFLLVVSSILYEVRNEQWIKDNKFLGKKKNCYLCNDRNGLDILGKVEWHREIGKRSKG